MHNKLLIDNLEMIILIHLFIIIHYTSITSIFINLLSFLLNRLDIEILLILSLTLDIILFCFLYGFIYYILEFKALANTKLLFLLLFSVFLQAREVVMEFFFMSF